MHSISDLVEKAIPCSSRYSVPEFERYWRFISKRGPFLRFDIRKNKVNGPESRTLNFLRTLAEWDSLPDLSLIYFYQDCIGKFGFKTKLLARFQTPIPIFVSAKTDDQKHQVLFCDWHYDPHCNESSSWNGMVFTLASDSELTNWESKIDRMIWRGGPNDGPYTPKTIGNYPRGRLVLFALKFPEFVDASFNNYPLNFIVYRKYFEEAFPIKFIAPLEMAKYKYQIDIDGVTATFTGLAWKLLSGSLVFKQQSENKTWFHDLLIPWVHYVPLRKDISDLGDKLAWAKANDEKCRFIASAGRELIRSSVLPRHMQRYCVDILVRYASLFGK